MINVKWAKTSSMIICNEKRHGGMQKGDAKKILCNCSFWNVIMLIIIPRDLDLYPIANEKQMKLVDAHYNVRVEYWALKNNVHEYKVP